MVASYRDFRAAKPSRRRSVGPRIPIGLCGGGGQNAPGDVGCLDPVVPCSEDPTQLLRARRHQIRIFKVDSKSARGPCLRAMSVTACTAASTTRAARRARDVYPRLGRADDQPVLRDE